MYCPYCGLLFSKNELWTQDQLRYVQEKANEQIENYALREIDSMLSKTFGKKSSIKNKNSAYSSLTYESRNLNKKSYIKTPIEEDVDSEIECSECKSKFQVYGIFGFCPLCGYDNILIYDTNASIIKKEVQIAKDKNRALRFAYNDLVSTFEDFCKKKNTTQKKYNFQNLDSAEKFFQEAYNASLFAELEQEKVHAIRRLFQKRHVYQHNKGIIDQQYITIIPEDSTLLGQRAPLSLEELESVAKSIRQIMLKIL